MIETLPRLLPPYLVAEALGIHVNTLKRIPREDLPYYRVVSRGDRRYDEADVMAYLERNRHV